MRLSSLRSSDVWVAVGVCWLLAGVAAAPAAAQGVEVVGTRALGMAGAFVAVADDPSAVYWNPAGIVRSGLIGLTIDRQMTEPAPDRRDLFRDGSSTLVALATPPLGISYYRLETIGLSEEALAVVNLPANAVAEVMPLKTHNVGGTITQSLGEYVDVGATVRYVRADLLGHTSQTVDADLGALLVFGQLRAGLLVRNLREPEIETGIDGVALSIDRQVRAGFAWQDRSSTTTVSVDVDLTTNRTIFGDRKNVAIGGERWWAGRRIGTRGGVRFDTTDDAQPVGAAGLSLRVSSSLFVEGQITRGGDDTDRSWGVAIRFAY